MVEPAILEVLLADLLLRFGQPQGNALTVVREWLNTSESGSQLLGYLREEADLATAAADRLRFSGDEDLTVIARELDRAGERLHRLAG